MITSCATIVGKWFYPLSIHTLITFLQQLHNFLHNNNYTASKCSSLITSLTIKFIHQLSLLYEWLQVVSSILFMCLLIQTICWFPTPSQTVSGLIILIVYLSLWFFPLIICNFLIACCMFIQVGKAFMNSQLFDILSHTSIIVSLQL